MSACASNQIRPMGLFCSRKKAETPETEPIAIEWSPPRVSGNSPYSRCAALQDSVGDRWRLPPGEAWHWYGRRRCEDSEVQVAECRQFVAGSASALEASDAHRRRPRSTPATSRRTTRTQMPLMRRRLGQRDAPPSPLPPKSFPHARVLNGELSCPS